MSRVAAALAGCPRELWPADEEPPSRGPDVEAPVDEGPEYVDRPRWSDNRYSEDGT